MDNNIFNTNMPGINWNDQGAADAGFGAADLMGMSNVAETVIQDDLICKNFVINGYIAPRKNTLSVSLDETVAKETFEEELKERRSRGEVPMIDGKEIKSYSQKALKALKGEDFVEGLKGNGHYRMNIKEAKAEFYVLRFTGTRTDSEVVANLSDFSEATSPDNKTLVIKPRKLFDQVIEQQEGIMPIVGNADPNNQVGKVCPIYQTGTGKSSNKIVLKTQYITKENTKATDIGYLDDVIYAVNKRYEGEAPEETSIVIENATFVDRYDPDMVADVEANPEKVKLTIMQKDLPLDENGNKQNQEIPYGEYAIQYETMGVTEDMLEQIRKPKSSRKTTTITYRNLKQAYEESRRLYQQHKASLKK